MHTWRMFATFAESNEGMLLFEKCKVLSMRPSDVLELTEEEDLFLTHAIIKGSKHANTT